MIQRALASLLVAAALITPGCSSLFGTLSGEVPGPYAGVRLDAMFMGKLPLWCIVDLPFSLALDTALLPITIWTGLAHFGSSRTPDSPSEPPRVERSEPEPRPTRAPRPERTGDWNTDRPFDAPRDIVPDVAR